MTVSDNICSAIETILIKTPALYRSAEILPKKFLISTGVQSWSHADVFTSEPIRMSTKEAFLAANRVNPLFFPKTQPEQDYSLS